jgi:Gpi18-like mannosyltransferase
MLKKTVKRKKRPLLSGVLAGLLLTIILCAGLTLRLSLAPMEGYGFDVAVNQKWSKSAVEFGLGASYTEQIEGNMLPNYPPVALAIFATTGWLYRATLSPDFAIESPLYDVWIKMPAIIADLLTAVVLWAIFRKRNPKTGLAAAAIYILHPGVWYNSAVWGQTDALYTLPLLLGLWAYATRRMMLAGMLLTLSVLTKFQAIAAFPVLLPCLLRPRDTLKMIAGGCIALTAVAFPFALGGGLSDIINVYKSAVGYYPQVSLGAYNFWWSLLGDTAWSIDDTAPLLGAMSYRTAGFLLFIAACGWIIITPRLLKKGTVPMQDIFLGAALLCFAFFLFPTQIHERYLFPFFALALPAALRNRSVLPVYAIVSLGGFLNVLGVLPWGQWDTTLFSTFFTIDTAIATTLTILWVLMTVQFNRAQTKSLSSSS